MQHIQQELVLHILSYFHSSPCSPSDATTLYSAALTCRNWYNLSIELLYESPNPQSYIALKALHKTLTNFNPSLTRHVKNLHMPIYTTWFSTSCSKRMAWRGKTVLEICDYRPDAEEEVREYVTMSQTDYRAALRIYEDIAAVCKELDRGSMPVSQSMDPRIHWDETEPWDDLSFGTGIGNVGSIRSMKELTLSPLVFPDNTKTATASNFQNPLFPNLTKLTLLNLIMLYPLSIMLHPHTLPSLTTLHIDGLSSPYSVFVEMLKPMGAQLKTLGVRRCIFYRTDNDNDDTDEEDDYLSESISGEAIPPSVTTLHLEASASSDHHRPQSVLRPSSHTEGVTHLVLHASHPSTWIELRAFPNLESLEVVYRPSSSRCYYSRQKYYQHAFRMADAISSLIKTQSPSRGGKFKRLSIHWTIKTYTPVWSSPDPDDTENQTQNEEVENALVLGYCLSRRCALYGVSLNWKLNTTQDDFFRVYPDVPPYKERNRHRWCRYPPRSEAAREKGGSGTEKLKRRVVPWADSALTRVGFISY